LSTDAIVFIFPYRDGPGGVNVLFLRMAEYLVGHTDRKIFIVDYPDGYMTHNRKDSRVEIIPYHPGEKTYLPPDSVAIFQAVPPWHAWRGIYGSSAKTRFLFWHLHPRNFFWNFARRPGKEPLPWRNPGAMGLLFFVKNFLSQLIDRRGLVTMDGENQSAIAELAGNTASTVPYLPVCVDGFLAPVETTFKGNIGWLGRLADFKVPILIHSMERVAELANLYQKRFVFHIWGKGPMENDVHSAARRLESEFFRTEFYGEIAMTDIPTIRDRVEVIMSMGTAALDGARIGLPVILLDYSYEHIAGRYVFRWLHEAQNYSLGREIVPDMLDDHDESLDRMFRQFDTDYQRVAAASHGYCVSEHSVSAVAERLLFYVDQTKASWALFEKYQNSIVIALLLKIKTSLEFLKRDIGRAFRRK